MNISILHISDLHRDPANPIRNDVLLDSLENDRRRYTADEEPRIKSPDLIIISGDIIQGIKFDEADPDQALRAQYAEALDFLGRLADGFVRGDRNRVIIIPGNHDVSAWHFKRSLQEVNIAPDRKKDLMSRLFGHDSLLRWSWSDFALFEIVDRAMYARRLAAFSEYYGAFYENARTYDLDPKKQFDLFDYPELSLTVSGFSSCYNNDLYYRPGDIHPACIAQAGERFRHPSLHGRLRVAVWHHNSEGPPMQSDYMNPDIVQNLIDRGFSLGFHGHQHRPQFFDTRFRHGQERRITVISAGTLCGGASFRFGRAYNLIELDIAARTGRLYVREMQNDDLHLPIWGRRPLPPNTSPFYDFSYDAPPAPIAFNANTTALAEAQNLYDRNDFGGASQILTPIVATEPLARPLLLDCLIRIKDRAAIIRTFDPPASDAEAIHVMDALWEVGNRKRLKEILTHPFIATSSDPSVIEMRNKYAVRLGK
jgi:predicted MPP superfamily phosphohydrolase